MVYVDFVEFNTLMFCNQPSMGCASKNDNCQSFMLSIYCITMIIKYNPSHNWNHIYDNLFNRGDKILWKTVRPIYHTLKLHTIFISSRVLFKLLFFIYLELYILATARNYHASLRNDSPYWKKRHQRSHLADSKLGQTYQKIYHTSECALIVFQTVRSISAAPLQIHLPNSKCSCDVFVCLATIRRIK